MINKPKYLLLFFVFLFQACDTISASDLAGQCFDREVESHFFRVDSHLHFQPFGGEAIDHEKFMSYLKNLGMEAANMYGIGQTLPYDSPCTYYLDCPGTPVVPRIQNDFVNAKQSLSRKPGDTDLTLSASFFDFSKPESILTGIQLLDYEFPNLFKWAGEINLVKQALFPNGHRPVTVEEIQRWELFMSELAKRSIPLAIHSDLGNNTRQTEYLHLMKTVLDLYPDNKIVWVHLGLSLQLTNIKPQKHIAILQELLDQHPNLSFDLSWRVLYDYYFRHDSIRPHYVKFINKNYDRFITGTDFIASGSNSFDDYFEAVRANSYINRFMDNRAFRHIALGINYYRLLGVEKVIREVCDRS